MAEEYIQWNDVAQTLAEKFWPGPLTIVLPSRINSKIAKTARASLPSDSSKNAKSSSSFKYFRPIGQTLGRTIGKHVW
jgi:L-threonylcarbamoyladenylate synthase